MTSVVLSEDVWLTSLQELQKSIQDPKYRRDLTPTTLSLLLRSHLHHLKDPFQPFSSPSAASKQKVQNGGRIEIPESKDDSGKIIEVEVKEGEKGFALDLSERLGIDEVEALIMVIKFNREEFNFIIGNESSSGSRKPANNGITTEATLNQLTRYYQAECLALSQLVTTIIFRAAGTINHDPMEDLINEQDIQTVMPIGTKAKKLDFLAEEVLGQLVGSIGNDLVQWLFSAFARAAHQAVHYKHGKEMAKTWALHYLKLQVAFLEALFQAVFWGMARMNADTAVGLIQGIFGSTFGSQQANARLIESQNLVEAGYWLEKIETLLGLLALETLGLSGISRGNLVPIDLWDRRDSTPKSELVMTQSKEAIALVHETIGTATQETLNRNPFPLVLLAWSFILSRIHPEALPQNQVGEVDSYTGEMATPVWQTVASIALAGENKLFPKWQAILKGRGFWKDETGEVGDDYVVSYKDTMNCLMVGLSTVIRPSAIQEYTQLAGVFTSLYGEGSVDAVSSVCGDFWRNSAIDGRREVLETAAFPLFPTTLVELLAALSGAGTGPAVSPDSLEISGPDAARPPFDYFVDLNEITLLFKEPSDSYTRELKGQTVFITLSKDLALPSGQVLPAKSQGTLVSRSGEDTMAVKWSVELSGWLLLISLMTSAVQAVGDPSANPWSRFVDTSDMAGIVASGLRFIHNILSLDPELANQLVQSEDLSASLSRAAKSGQADLLAIAFTLLDRSFVNRSDGSWREAVSLAMSIITVLLPRLPQRIWSELRSSGFFAFPRQDDMTIKMIIDRDSQTGEYSSTIHALNLILKLAGHVQLGQFQIDPQVVHNRSNTLANTIRFLHQNVWSRYRTWSYTKIGQKAQIASTLFKIYTSVLQNPTASLQNSQFLLHTLNSAVMQSIVYTSSDFDLRPLLDVIHSPLHGSVGNKSLPVDRLRLEQSLCAALQLAYHIVVAGQGLQNDMGLLSIIANRTAESGESDQTHVIEAIFEIAVSPYLDDETAMAALRLLHILIIQSSSTESTFSLMSCLGSPHITSARLVDLLAKGARSPEVQDAAWQVVRVMAENQPALARFCLKIDREDKVERSTALNVAIASILAWDQPVSHDSRLLNRSIGLLQDLYSFHSDLVVALGIAEDEALWNAVRNLAMELQLKPKSIDNQMLASGEERDLDSLDAYIQHCYRRGAKAIAIRLLQTILDKSLTSQTQDRADAKSALKLLSSGEEFARFLADSTSSAFDPVLRSQQAALIQTVLPAEQIAYLQSPSPRSVRRYGDQYIFDTNVLESIFDLSPLENIALVTCFRMISVNESATATDADVATSAALLAQSTIDFAHEIDVAATAASAFCAYIAPVSEESREGEFAVKLQMERYQLMQTLMETTWVGGWRPDEVWIRKTIQPLSCLLNSASFPLIEPFASHTIPAYYRPLINVLTIYIRYTRVLESSKNLNFELEDLWQSVVPAIVQLLDDILTAVQANADELYINDLDHVVSVIGGLSSTGIGKELCFQHLEHRGLVLRSCEMLSLTNIMDSSVLKSLTRLHWALSQSVAGAEKLSSHGVLRGYAGTVLLQNLSIRPQAIQDQLNSEVIWTTMLSVARSLLRKLPHTVEYVSTEILPFVDTMHRRIQTALAWNLETESLLVQLAEVHSILEILLHIAREVEVDLALSKQLLHRYCQPVLAFLLNATSALARPKVIKIKVAQKLAINGEDFDMVETNTSNATSAAYDSVIQALLITSFSSVTLLSEWMSISTIFSRSSSGFANSPTRLPSVSTHMTASRILVEYANCLMEIDIQLISQLDTRRSILPEFTASWPAVSEEKIDIVRNQALETTLLVASVQTAGVYLADKASDSGEKPENEKGLLSKGSVSKKKNLDRRQGKQDLRDVVDCVKRFRDDEALTAICTVCYIYLETRCGNLSDI